ncbi:MAG: nitroreductase family protein [Deltaproteobacteria bacterium]|nr:nitroreductase family protein [Deltaproteobacteria bacterium]
MLQKTIKELPEPAQHFSSLVNGRHSIRKFKPQPIPESSIDFIAKMTNRAPSAGNLQAFQVFIVSDVEIRQRLAEASLNQDCVRQAPIVLVFCTNPLECESQYGLRGKELYSLQDATIATTYAQLAASSLGLASVWVGAFDEQAITKILCLPPELRPIALLPVGHPAENPEPTGRRDWKDVFRPLPL